MDREWSPGAAEATKRLRQFITQNFGELRPSLLDTATKVVRGLKAFNLSAFGFGVGFDRETDSTQQITPAVFEALLDTLAVPLASMASPRSNPQTRSTRPASP